MANRSHRQLLVAVLLIVVLAAGILVYSYVDGRRPVDATEAEAMSEQLQVNTNLMQEDLAGQIQDQHLSSDERERMDSATGQALANRCLKWTDLYDSHPTDSNKDGREEACEAYHDFVATGGTGTD